jgi:hypothetical protein
MLLSILMCGVTLVNHCQEGTSIGKFAMYISPQKSHAADILGEDHDTKTPKKRAAGEMGFTMRSKH